MSLGIFVNSLFINQLDREIQGIEFRVNRHTNYLSLM